MAGLTFGLVLSHDGGTTWTWMCEAAVSYGGIMKTTDLRAWIKVLRYQDLTNAASCGADTLQQNTCVPMWCAVCAQLGCTSAASYACPVLQEAPPSKAGCCDTGSGAGGPLALSLSVATVWLRPRRKRDP